MPYASESDLAAVFGGTVPAQLAAEKGASPADVSAVVASVLADASALMDSFLGARYVVPIVDDGAVMRLKPHCLAIAKWMLLGRRAGTKYDETAEKGYDAAISWLEGVAKAQFSLAGAAVPSAPSVVSSGSGGSEPALFKGGLGF